MGYINPNRLQNQEFYGLCVVNQRESVYILHNIECYGIVFAINTKSLKIGTFMNKYTKALKDTLTDPGFGFGVALTFLFAASSPVGLTASIIASTLIAGIKLTQNLAPDVFARMPKVDQMLHDPRTPLRIIGLSGLVVMGAALAITGIPLAGQVASMGEFFVKGWAPMILPALTSLGFALGDFGLARSIGNATTAKTEDISQSVLSKFVRILKRPETTLAVGNLGVGLMSGGLAVIAFPFVIGSFALAVKNVLKNDAEYKSHPNIYMATANLAFGAIALAAGNPIIAIGDMLSCAYLTILDSKITPGGFKQVFADIKKDFVDLVGALTSKKTKQQSAAQMPEFRLEQQSSFTPAYLPLAVIFNKPAAEAIPAVTSQTPKSQPVQRNLT